MGISNMTAPEKNKGGRPKKDVKGEAIWVPDIYVNTVKEFLTMLKNIHQQQQA